MAATQTSAQEISRGSSGAKGAEANRPANGTARRAQTDDEILGIAAEQEDGPAPNAADTNSGAAKRGSEHDATDPENKAAGTTGEPENLRAAFEENPELREAWQNAQAYKEAFATPQEARAATELLADLNHIDALFFSQRPADHVALARNVAELDPGAFASLLKAMNGLAAETQKKAESASSGREAAGQTNEAASIEGTKQPASATAAQEEFFHATNAAAVKTVIEAVEAQVERLLPEGTSKTARNRVVGEIYRELDNTLRSNRQLAQQMREAFRSGGLDADHQQAIVSLIAGRARQALPGVAKRVLSEWTSTVMAAHEDRRTRQRTAEGRVDIAGSSRTGSESRRQMTPRDIDYARMSDADILNL